MPDGSAYSELSDKIDAPVESTDPEACTQYIAAGPIQYYYIWCINKPMRTIYETIRIDLISMKNSPLTIEPIFPTTPNQTIARPPDSSDNRGVVARGFGAVESK